MLLLKTLEMIKTLLLTLVYPQVLLAQKDKKVRLDLTVLQLKDKRVSKAPRSKDRKVKRVLTDRTALTDQTVRKVRKDKQDLTDLLLKDKKVRLELMVLMVLTDRMVLKVRKVRRDLMDLQ